MRVITLLSNAGLSTFPDNTLFDFSNPLHNPIQHGSKSREVRVRLKNLYLTTGAESVRDGANVGYIQLHLSQLRPTRLNDAHEQCLARLPYPSSVQFEDYHFYEVDHAPAISLLGFPINQLTLKVTDRHGESLTLAEGPPTIVELEVVRMASSEFHMHCMSVRPDSKLYFPDNTHSNFRVKVSDNLNLRGWEVAISAVTFPPDMFLSCPAWVEIDGTRVEMDFADCEHNGDVGWFVNSKLTEYLPAALKFSIILGNSQDETVALMLDDREGADDITVSFSASFLRVFKAEHLYAAGEEIVVPWGGSVDLLSDDDIDLDRAFEGSSVAMIYCDIVEPRMVGETRAPLIQILPLHHFVRRRPAAGSDGGRCVYQPQHLTFHPIRHTFVDDIEFDIRNPSGQRHRIRRRNEDGSDGMGISLLFRPMPEGEEDPV